MGLLVGVLCLTAVSFNSVARAQEAKVGEVKLPEPVVRLLATSRTIPAFPPDSARALRSGVAVVYLACNSEGKLTSVRVVQSPDENIRDSVMQAVQKWEFTPFLNTDKKPMPFVGPLVFYFIFRNGKPAVISPAELFMEPSSK